ncbi:CAAX farnesyltransferase (FTase) subunit beta [Colletotrichum fioriniae]|uniref:CAAX farnesyltransferase (FTase) subunit beta n=1 Tax=Colletotrichum fioriniae TaxID=710243 RepID=UPI0032DA33B9|nr:CAAX farnesyltransferase (FTase) subunit beta [Colletotrichum fioriniae]
MRPRIKPLKRRTKATFIKRAVNMAASAQTGSPQRSDSDVDEEFIDDLSDMGIEGIETNSTVPELFTASPPVRDTLPTATSYAQDATVRECVPLLAATDSDIDHNAHRVPSLLRDNHIKFLQKQLGRFPAPYVAADASRPWFLYWSLNALALLGYDTAVYREDLIKTVRTMQNPSGGIGGGHGQDSHLATTYAVVLALAIVGGEDAYEVIDRKAMWKWLCSLKQPSGGIQMALGGEVDVRGAYCAAVIVTLLSLPLDLSTDSPAWTPERPTLFTGLADYVRRCAIELEDQPSEASFTSHQGSLYSREGLIRYILPSDAYHTCYVLSGLSSAQHQWDLTYVNEDETILSEPKWVASPCAEGTQVFNEEDRVGTIHPVYTIPQESVDDMKAYFASKQGF